MAKKKSTNTTTEEKLYRTEKDWSYIAQIMLDYSQKKDSYSIEKFLCNLGISWTAFENGLKNCETLKDAYEIALMRIGVNREQLAIERNLNMGSVTAFTLPHYHKRYKEQLEYRAQLAKKEGSDNKNITVIVEPFKEE